MRAFADAEGSVMGFMASCIRYYQSANSRTRTDDATHNIYITKLVKPEVINRVSRSHEVTFVKLLVRLCGGDVELVKDPFLDETLVASGLFFIRERESQENYNLAFISKTGNKLWVWLRI